MSLTIRVLFPSLIVALSLSACSPDVIESEEAEAETSENTEVVIADNILLETPESEVVDTSESKEVDVSKNTQVDTPKKTEVETEEPIELDEPEEIEESIRRLTITDFQYQGGFRLSSGKFGSGDNSTLSYSPGAIALNKENNSLIVISHAYEQGLGEFKIPEIVNSRDMTDFNVGDEVIQNFADFYETDRVDTGITAHFSITGMEKIGKQLVVNYYNWYDAPGTETDTSIVFENVDDLANSAIYGPFQMEGAAHAGGWLTPIPENLQEDLGGTYVSGWAKGSIISRLSVGPSAFVQTPAENLLISTTGGEVETEAVLDFSLHHILYDKVTNPDGIESTNAILYNDDKNNNLWTISSKATYGFIVPNTDTYITLGGSAGHEGGLGYKITQDNDNLCGGPCPYLADDVYSYYWLWSVEDLIKVKNGELAPHDVRPYEYGDLNLPVNNAVSGGAFDYENNLLYVSVKNGDTVGTYSRPPIFFVFKLK